MSDAVVTSEGQEIRDFRIKLTTFEKNIRLVNLNHHSKTAAYLMLLRPAFSRT